MTEPSKDCWQCRLTSGGGLIVAGVYVSNHGKKLRVPSKYYVSAIGYGLSTLGVLRILNLPPFKNRKRTDEKNKLEEKEENEYIVGKFPSKF